LRCVLRLPIPQFRIDGGQIAEAWEVYDEAGMWRQLGVAPPTSG
jgi:hypothetical protein